MKPEPTKLNLVLILTGGYGFPTGDAYTNRILAFAKGFVKNGCRVSLLIIYPGRKNQVSKSGSMEGFDYYFCTSPIWPDGKLRKIATGIKGIFNSLIMLQKLNRESIIDAIITFSQKFSQNFPVYLFTRLKGILFFRENNEYPRIVLSRGHDKLSSVERLYFSFVNRFFDGYIYISTSLVAFNKPFIGKNMPVMIVPIIVDDDRFIFDQFPPQKEITFCGNLYGEKDGVTLLIQSFALIHKDFPAYILKLIGHTSNPVEFEKLSQLVYELEVSEKVVFTGFVHRDHVPELLDQSALLVLARPDNIQAKGGFPTKLGEYLATGRPVLVTSVGDIPNYIHDGVNGFLARPGSVEDFAGKIRMILQDYENAADVGKEGKKLSLTSFNNKFQAERILGFIEMVKNNKN
ncbi:glycosyltransferase [Lentimicrobium saccharophilum]|uniref:Glycosyltransferase n=1 Tax=Lentimicrobium saccharophilum TaxID=1678841 RepID=A0A0S7BZC7_9BACT|nr:glycosyltransferase family 4 protein [Lentimicrobium saccharophilum]GAP42358.1 glycosyltransferase [Lentimicrobium saccharophilum]